MLTQNSASQTGRCRLLDCWGCLSSPPPPRPCRSCVFTRCVLVRSRYVFPRCLSFLDFSHSTLFSLCSFSNAPTLSSRWRHTPSRRAPPPPNCFSFCWLWWWCWASHSHIIHNMDTFCKYHSCLVMPGSTHYTVVERIMPDAENYSKRTEYSAMFAKNGTFSPILSELTTIPCVGSSPLAFQKLWISCATLMQRVLSSMAISHVLAGMSSLRMAEEARSSRK